MKRKILVTFVVLAAGAVMLLVYDSEAAAMVQDAMGVIHFHASKFISSALSSLGTQGVGTIVMVVVGMVAVIAFGGRDADKG